MTSAATHGYLPLLSTDEAVEGAGEAGGRVLSAPLRSAPPRVLAPGMRLPPGLCLAVASLGGLPADAGNAQRRRGGAGRARPPLLHRRHRPSRAVPPPASTSPASPLERLWDQMRTSYHPGATDVTKSPYRTYFVSSVGQDRPPIAVFTRDERTGIQVWSGEHGYPGDGWYLDFHKKHFPGGHRYWRVTSSSRAWVTRSSTSRTAPSGRVQENADHFCHLVHDLLADQPAGSVLCAPYDAELFGHWWFEGPEWLYRVVKGNAANPAVNAMTCAEHLDAVTPEAAVSLPEGSWGQGGFHWVWLNEWTEWIWRDIYTAEADFPELARMAAAVDDATLRDLVQQAARELLLLEGFRLALLDFNLERADYAEKRASDHYQVFSRLAGAGATRVAGEPLAADTFSFWKRTKCGIRSSPLLMCRGGNRPRVLGNVIIT